MYRVTDERIAHDGACEINVALHCNLRCRSCDHLSPLYHRSFIDPGRAKRDLSVLATVYRPAFVKLIGGEPLLHPELLPLIDAARASGIADGVSVITNGTLLPRMSTAFWEAVDEIWMSAYPGHELPEAQLRRIADLAERFSVSVTMATTSHFREAYAAAGTEDPDLVRRIYTTCQLAHRWKCHTILDGHFFKCSRAAFTPGVLAGERPIRSAFPTPPDSGVALVPGDDLLPRLLAYLNDDDALPACRYCMGSVGLLHRHEQGHRRDLLAETPRRAMESLDTAQLKRLAHNLDHDDGCVSSFTHWGPPPPWDRKELDPPPSGPHLNGRLA